jgi:methionyl-tRNA formyltransferase
MRVIYVGTGEIGVKALEALIASEEFTVVGVVTQPDKPVGRHQKIEPSAIKVLAMAKKIPVYQPEKISDKNVLSQLGFLKSDVIVVCAYGQILRKGFLALPKLGCINIHASLLPKYRGASCIQAAIQNGDKKTGITTMWMDEGIDTGDILLQESIGIKSDDTAQTLHDRLRDLAPSTILKSLQLMAKDKAPRIKQNDADANYVTRLNKEDGLINWDQDQKVIDCHIRAMNPWPSAFSYIGEGDNKKSFKIFSTIISNRSKGKPGEVLRIDKHGILVAAKKGGLLLREVQLEGRKRMSGAEFGNSQILKVGSFLNSQLSTPTPSE